MNLPYHPQGKRFLIAVGTNDDKRSFSLHQVVPARRYGRGPSFNTRFLSLVSLPWPSDLSEHILRGWITQTLWDYCVSSSEVENLYDEALALASLGRADIPDPGELMARLNTIPPQRMDQATRFFLQLVLFRLGGETISTQEMIRRIMGSLMGAARQINVDQIDFEQFESILFDTILYDLEPVLWHSVRRAWKDLVKERGNTATT